MSEFDSFGGLTSETGSIGGGGDGNRHDDDRSIFFPEFDEWGRVNKAILKITTRAKLAKRGIEEQITIDIDFNDGAWRPSSTILANSELPKKGDKHPTIDGCFLDDVSISNYNNQPDHFRATLTYKYPEADKIGGVRGDGTLDIIPVDEPFLIEFTPQVSQVLLSNDISEKKVAIVNPNGEPYELYTTKVRLDGVCRWNQFEWDQTEAEKWTNVINRDTWEIGDYKFAKETVLLSYVVGNIRFYTNSDGQRIKYYEMTAGISIKNDGWGVGGGIVDVRRQGSFYYTKTAEPRVKHPRDLSLGRSVYDLNGDGLLESAVTSIPIVPDPSFDKFQVYKTVNFNFVELTQ